MRLRYTVIVGVAIAACSPSPATETAPPTPVTTTSTTTPEAPATTGAISSGPMARMGHAMVAIGDGELLVFGGRSYQGSAEIFLDDTWVYSTESGLWRPIDASGPLARSQHAMAYDPHRDEVLLFGGYVGSSFTYGDTWVLDVGSEQWRRLDPVVTPSARAGSVLSFDTNADSYVMFAGAEDPPAAELPLAETWLFDPDAGEWRQTEAGVVPVLVSEGHPTLFELAMVFDTGAATTTLLVAGESTWAFDSVSEAWTRVDEARTQGLGADYMTAATYDVRRGRVVAYGGAPVERTAQTWAFDANADRWTPVVGDGPGPLANHAMAYDEQTGAVYIFGGAAAVLVLDGVPPVSAAVWQLGETGWILR